MIAVSIWTKLDPTAGPCGPRSNWREKVMALKDVWAVLVLFIIVIGGIYSGVFNATEAAAVGVFCAFLIALVRRKLTKENIMTSFRATLVTTGMIFLLIICAQIFSYFVAVKPSQFGSGRIHRRTCAAAPGYPDRHTHPLCHPRLHYGSLLRDADYHAYSVPACCKPGIRPDMVWCDYCHHAGDGTYHAACRHERVCDSRNGPGCPHVYYIQRYLAFCFCDGYLYRPLDRFSPNRLVPAKTHVGLAICETAQNKPIYLSMKLIRFLLSPFRNRRRFSSKIQGPGQRKIHSCHPHGE